MKLYPVELGNLKLDGGAMFGVVPKAIWNKTNPADSNNQIDIATRSLLIEDGDRLILIDAGMGTKQSSRFFSYYNLWGDFSIDSSLKKIGFHRDDITDVFLTHLHFDHCGGCIQWNNDKTGYETAFKNAIFWTNKNHWEWATNPNSREKASFLRENLIPLEESGQLKYISRGSNAILKNSELDFDIFFADGHTEKQMLPMLKYKGKILVFVADLLPTVGHIPLPYVMGYDTRPLLTLAEKELFLEMAAKENYYLFFEHDAHNEICTLQQTAKGVRLREIHKFSTIFD